MHGQPSWSLIARSLPWPNCAALLQENIEAASFKLPAEDYNTLSTLEFQLRYFNGVGLAIGKGKAYSTYEELWDEPTTSFQRDFDGDI